MNEPQAAPLGDPTAAIQQLAALKAGGGDPSALIAGLAGGGGTANNPLAALANLAKPGGGSQVIIDDDLKESIKAMCDSIKLKSDMDCKYTARQLEILNGKGGS